MRHCGAARCWRWAPAVGSDVGTSCRFFSAVAPLPAVDDAGLEASLASRGGRPLLLHCGAQWSARSRDLAQRIAEWGAAASDRSVEVASIDIEVAPRTVKARHIRVVPTLLLLRDGRIQQRADGGDPSAVERVLAAAGAYNEAVDPSEIVEPSFAMAAADESLRCYVEQEVETLDKAEAAYRRVLEGAGAGSPFAFRARLGVLRCALLRISAAPVASELAASAAGSARDALTELQEHHQREFEWDVRADAEPLARLVAHAELLVDFWTPPGGAEEIAAEQTAVLEHYAESRAQEALDKALSWYQCEAAADTDGLIEAYCKPWRRLVDRPGGVPASSAYAAAPFAAEPADLPGPAAPRAMLRRLFAALGPRSEEVSKARVDLEFLLDRKKHVPFYTRHLETRRGGCPKGGRGTGSGTGYSKRYWIAYGPERAYKNTKPMGGPHTNSYEGW